MSLARIVFRTLLTGSLTCLLLGLVAAPALAEQETDPLPLLLVDTFDPPALSRVYLVDPSTGVMTLRADLADTYTPPCWRSRGHRRRISTQAPTDPTGVLCQGISCLLLRYFPRRQLRGAGIARPTNLLYAASTYNDSLTSTAGCLP